MPGGAKMLLRSSDPDWLAAVDAWWNHLLPALGPYMVTQGGPVLMVQVILTHSTSLACLWSLTETLAVLHQIALHSQVLPP